MEVSLIVTAGWARKAERVPVERHWDGGWHRCLLYGWRLDEERGWVAHVRYSMPTEWGRGNFVDSVEEARVRPM